MNFGPPIIDWSPIASLGKTFLGAYDQAARRRQEAETRGLIDRTTASMGQGAPPQEMRPIASLGEPPAQQPMQGKASTFAAMEGDILPNVPGLLQYNPAQLNRQMAPGASKAQAEGAPQRKALPDGYTAAHAVDEAKKAIAAGRDKAALVQRLKAYGIDPKVLDQWPIK